jgi:hypothetical protein
VSVDPVGHQLGQPGLDLLGALGELVEQARRDALDVAVALDHRPPHHAEPCGQLGAEGRGVDPADGALLALQEPSVERQPLAGGVLDLGGHDGVGVQLGIGAAAGVLAEQRHGEALGVDLIDAVLAPPGHRPVLLEPVEGGHHGGVVGGQDLGSYEGIGRDRPQHRHALGR